MKNVRVKKRGRVGMRQLCIEPPSASRLSTSTAAYLPMTQEDSITHQPYWIERGEEKEREGEKERERE